jgi:adenylate cyclase
MGMRVYLARVRAWLRAWLIDGSLDDVPPARVVAAIRAQQDRSEILVSLVQLALVAFFAVLYTNAPMAEGFGQDLDPIPNILAVYGVVTMVRLVLALSHRLSPWMLYASVLADMALLMAVIWSYHLKYLQPPGFYLKAPTFVYVFLFIALRALRFEARYVLFAGAVAVGGWLMLLLFALGVPDELGLYGVPRAQDCPAHPCVTRNYLEYMRTDNVLIGAEVDKLVIVALSTAVLALAISRARRLLVRAIAESTAAQDLSRFLDPSVADRIRRSEIRIAAGQGELRHAAILTTDLRGFTELSASMAPDDVVKLLQDYQAHVCAAIQDKGGSIDKFLGDGILSSFGAARPGPSFAADALYAADAVLAAVDAWNTERAARSQPAVRVGLAVASGEVLFGAVGSGDRLEYTVIGDAVNLAAKLEKHTKQETVRALTDRATYDLALAQGYRPTQPHTNRLGRQVAGVGLPLDLVCLG